MPAARLSPLVTLLLSAIAAAQPAPPTFGDDAPEPPAVGDAADADQAADDLLNMDLDQLSNANVSVSVAVESFDETVTSVTRQESTVGMSPAAVYVITNDMIRRSGVRSIPEALRLAPGVHVAKIDSNKWAVSIRGFNDQYNNKLLVQIDGRTVYTPLFGGTYWDVQDLLLEDVERIEVVRGPGATVWGSNAVNGVINILTRSSRDTTGAYAIAGGGTYEEGFAGARIGGVAADGDLTWRVFGKWFERDRFDLPGASVDDSWSQARGGFRMDWTPTCRDTFTLQGDYYDGLYREAIVSGGSAVPASGKTTGGNVLARWTRRLSDDSAWSAQLYWDRTQRYDLVGYRHVDTVDFDFQHNFRWADRQTAVWGVGYRNISDLIIASAAGVASYNSESARLQLPSAFVQNQTELITDKTFLTLGVKIEDHYFAGVQAQPSIRLLTAIDQHRVLWGAVSRAVRTPTRSEDSIIYNPGPLTLSGSTDLESQELLAYELGYRAEPAEYFSWDAAAFYNVYEGLIGGVFTTFPTTAVFANAGNGHGYGVEATAKLQVAPNCRLSGNYSLLRLDVDLPALALTPGSFVEASSPRHQALLWSSWDVAEDWEVDLIGRYTEGLPAAGVAGYLTMDLRVGWRPNDRLECAVVGQNLLDSSQGEYRALVPTSTPTETPRGVFGSVQLRY